MANLKGLVKDTAIYGMSSIVGRFLNYLLVPLYTHYISAETGGYGVVTEVYAYTALLLVILTFGMETTFFRFANKKEEDYDAVFSTSFALVTSLSLVFVALVVCFIGPISAKMGYADHPEYIILMASTTTMDAIQAILFSQLRCQKRPIKFAFLKLLFIVLNIGANLFFFCVLKVTDVYYIFLLNIVCTSIIMLFFLYDIIQIKWKIDFKLLRRMFSYSWPLLVLGVAGILNQTFDKMSFTDYYTAGGLHTEEQARQQLGLYGACVKVAMIMAMITQAFRYAYEPIVFAKGKDKDSKEYYALAMKYFIIFTLFAFLCVMGYIDILKRIIASSYHEALFVIPIVMVAEIMMGVYFNLSFWYKLTDETRWGLYFSAIGCGVLALVNWWFVPTYGYKACAWGGVAGYGTAMVLSYVVGQIKNPIKYDLKNIFIYVVLTTVLYYGMVFVHDNVDNVFLRLAINTCIIALFVAYLVKKDMPLSGLPVVGKYFRKK